MEKRALQRRQGLTSQITPEYVCEHHHSQWIERDMVIFTGNTIMNAVVDTQIGQILKINPIVLMYAVKAELLITHDFAATPPDSFTITLLECAGSTKLTSITPSVYSVSTWDVSDYMGTMLKELCPVGLKTYIKVSNNLVPITVYGITLRLTMYKNDSFGGYEIPTDQLLVLKTKTNRDYILKRAKESEDFQYLSGLPME